MAFPLTVDRRGRTAEAGDTAHVVGMVEQVLFTAPGERVNRPTFGSGVSQLLFSPTDASSAAAAQLAAESALHTWLGDLIALERVEVEGGDGWVRITVAYRPVAGGETVQVTFDRGTFAPEGAGGAGTGATGGTGGAP